MSATPPAADRSLPSRYRGALLGLATGDALGTSVEFAARGTFEPVTELRGGGPFRLRAGEWTDDTSMALCLAESLVERDGFDPHDQLHRYCRWYREGYLSSNGRCFDIGNITRDALHEYERTLKPYPGRTDRHAAGNGSLMRLAPVPLFFAYDPRAAVGYAADSSRTTHGAPAAVDACRYFAGLIVGALQGLARPQLLSLAFSPLLSLWREEPLDAEIAEVAAGSFMGRDEREIVGTGHVVRTLEAALWAFAHSETFVEGALKVVNLGDDADTTGAVYGQLAGAFYGDAAIPAEWRDQLALRPRIEELADRLYAARRLRESAVRG